MVGKRKNLGPTSVSPWLVILFLIGVIGWLPPMVSAARRFSRTTTIPVPQAEDIVIPVQSTGEVCVRGTSISDSNRMAILGERTISLNETVHFEGHHYRVVAITAEDVRLRRISDTASMSKTNSAVQ